MDGLFSDSNGKIYSAQDVYNSLRDIGAGDCGSLFIHSDVMFGSPLPGFKRREYLSTLYQVVERLGVKQIIVPTFTYSFCNNEDYDVLNSKTSMGAFNEYVRKLDGRYRTIDPLLSVSVPSALKRKFENISNHSLGVDSGLDRLHHLDGVKFLFLGAEMADCFTYVHYVEKMMDVPYRFDMAFEGDIVDYDNKRSRRRQVIHTQCGGVKLPPKYDYFENSMVEKGMLKKKRLGNKYVACISECDAYREIANNIKNNINYYLEEPFAAGDLTHIYTYDRTKGRITHC